MTIIGAPDWQDTRQPQLNADVLFSGNIPNASFGITELLPPATGQYEGVAVILNPQVAQVIAVQVIDPITGINPQYLKFCWNMTVSTFLCPLAGFMGSQPTMTVGLSMMTTNALSTVEVIGLRRFPWNLRPDGNPRPRWSQSASFSPSAGTTTVVPAAGPPDRILVCGILIPSGTAAAALNWELIGTQNAAGITLANATYSTSPLNPYMQVFPEGLLLDVDTVINTVNGPVSTGRPGTVFYDYVS